MRVFRARAAAEVSWHSRVQSHSRIRLPGQKEPSILEVVTGLGDVDHWEGAVMVGKDHRLRARLLVQRVPDAVAAQRWQRVQDEAHGKRRPVSKDAMDLAAWTVVMTNASGDKLRLAEAMVLLKIRWQIELVFKLWKRHVFATEAGQFGGLALGFGGGCGQFALGPLPSPAGEVRGIDSLAAHQGSEFARGAGIGSSQNAQAVAGTSVGAGSFGSHFGVMGRLVGCWFFAGHGSSLRPST